MNPYPLLELNHFTVPCSFTVPTAIPCCSTSFSFSRINSLLEILRCSIRCRPTLDRLHAQRHTIEHRFICDFRCQPCMNHVRQLNRLCKCLRIVEGDLDRRERLPHEQDVRDGFCNSFGLFVRYVPTIP